MAQNTASLHTEQLIALSSRLTSEDRCEDALLIIEHLNEIEPENRAYTLELIKQYARCGRLNDAIQRIYQFTLATTNSDTVKSEATKLTKLVIAITSERVKRLVELGQIKPALNLVNALLDQFPDALPLHEYAISVAKVVGNMQHLQAYQQRLSDAQLKAYRTASIIINNAKDAGDDKAEIQARLALAKHPAIEMIHWGHRLDNIFHAICCLMASRIDTSSKVLIDSLLRNTPSPYPASTNLSGSLSLFDQFYRLTLPLLSTNRLLSPQLTAPPDRPVSFSDIEGRSLSLQDVIQYAKDSGAEVAFFAAGSQLYFEKSAAHYAYSIVQNCETPCLIFICISGQWGDPCTIAKNFPLRDKRIILCSDSFDCHQNYRIFYPPKEISTLPINYYPSVGLINLNLFVDHLKLPVFLTGMDTVLMRDVGHILHRFAAHDLVLNKVAYTNNVSSKIINSLQLFKPNLTSRHFYHFYYTHFLPEIQKQQQPFAMDQLFLFLTLTHLQHTLPEGKIGYFDEYDINNGMFNKNNVGELKDHLSQYTFINIFNMGQGSEAATADALI